METTVVDLDWKLSESLSAFTPFAEARDLEADVFPLYSAKPALDEDEEYDY